jgi:cation transport ATPase
VISNNLEIFLNEILQVTTVVFDKTGTLTKKEIKVVEYELLSTALGISASDLLQYVAQMESNSDHPIAKYGIFLIAL